VIDGEARREPGESSEDFRVRLAALG
jgi:hypothetical protein